jgi:hypothetical protein
MNQPPSLPPDPPKPPRETLPTGVSEPPPNGDCFVPLVLGIWPDPEDPLPPFPPNLPLDFGPAEDNGSFVLLGLPMGVLTAPIGRSEGAITAPPDEGLPVDDPTLGPTVLLPPELERAHGIFMPPNEAEGGETDELPPDEAVPPGVAPPITGALRPASGGRNVLTPWDEPPEEKPCGVDTPVPAVGSERFGFGMFRPDGRLRPDPPAPAAGAGLTEPVVTGDFGEPNELGPDFEPPDIGLRKEPPLEGRNSDEPDPPDEPPLDRPLLKPPARDDPIPDPRELEKPPLEPPRPPDELKLLPEEDE